MKLRTPYYIEVESIHDLARLVCAFERAPLPVFSLPFHGDNVLAVQADLLMGRPVIYYAKYNMQGGFLAYRNVSGFEDITVVEAITNPTFAYAPIIQVDKLPDSMIKNAKADRNSSYISIKLKDVASLAKVSSFKMFYDEAPLPLFLFKDKKPILGTFLSMNDGDNVSYFYYVVLGNPPSGTFMKYSNQRVEKPEFTNKIDEHGYIYMKIVRLRKNHPLVMLHD